MAPSAPNLAAPSFGFWAEDYRRPMLALAFKVLRSAGDAEDAVQDAMLKLFRAEVDLDANPRSYALRTAYTCAVEILRRRRGADVSYRDDMDRAPETGRPVDAEWAHRCRSAVDDLPEQYGRAIALLADDLTYDEIAAATGAPVGTVRSRIHRGRKILAPLLKAA